MSALTLALRRLPTREPKVLRPEHRADGRPRDRDRHRQQRDLAEGQPESQAGLHRGRVQRLEDPAAGDVTAVPYTQRVVALGEGAKAGIAAFEDRAFGR